MLATTSSAFGNLQTLRLALALATRDPALVPPPLAEQITQILRQALEIANDSNSITEETRAEAIALAYAMRSSPDLSTDILRLTQLPAIDKATAGNALQHLDAAFVA